MKSALRNIISGILCTAFTFSSMPISSVAENDRIICALRMDDTALTATASDVTADGILEYKKYEDHVEITDCDTSAEGEIIIPDTIDGLPVTSIGDHAFWNCSSLTSVTIPESVTSIGDYTFWDCSALTSITIPENVISIGDHVFWKCSSLASVTLPDHITSIGDYAFRECLSLTSVTIPESVTSIEDYAFRDCSALTSIIIENADCEISDSSDTISSTATIYGYPGSTAQAYAEKYNREFVSLEDQETPVIGYLQYEKYDDHVEITGCDKSAEGEMIIPGMIDDLPVTSIGEKAFLNCYQLKSVIIPFGVTSIGDEAFQYCFDLESVSIPNSVTTIGNLAFWNCDFLVSVMIPESVTSIGDAAFNACSRLTSVTIENRDCEIFDAEYTFSSTAVIYGYPDSTAQAYAEKYNREFVSLEDQETPVIGYLQYEKYDDHVEITDCDTSAKGEIIIPETIEGLPVTSIGEMAFGYCSSLTLITIPDSVISIGDDVFSNCSALTSITIPNSVTSIGDYEFYNCSALTSITIPNSVTSIEDSAFSRCSSLKSITIPDSVIGIGWDVFSKCSSLTSITIPNSVTSIGGFAFYDCSSLESITIPDSVTDIKSLTFFNCSALTSITIENADCEIYGSEDTISSTAVIYGYPDSTAQAYAEKYNREFVSLEDQETPVIGYLQYEKYDDHVEITGCDKSAEGEIIIPDTIEGLPVTVIGEMAFAACSSLTLITIPDSVTSIEKSAFAGCSALLSVTLPGSITNIEEGTLAECYSLESITIPDGVTEIGSDAFRECSSLTTITIPDSVTEIGSDAFRACSSLITIAIPDSVTNIEGYAFSGCSALVSVVIPDSVKSIGSFTFYGCSALTSITIPDSVTNIDNKAFSGCSSLESITIPDSVTGIEWDVFSECSSLTSITIQNKDCKIYDGETTISSTATIYGYTDSTAQAYAEKYNRTFIALDAPAETTTTSTSTTTTTATSTTTAPENAELVIPIDALNMGESVTVTLKGEPNQKIEPEFDFSAADLNQDINDEFNAAPEQLDENGEYPFIFEAPWDMNPFSIRIGYSGSPITYTVDYDRKKEDTPVFTEGGDNWSFSNSRNYFGETYFINADYKDTLLGKLSNVEKETMNKKLHKKWGGSCFGMAITSILASNAILTPSDYQNGTNFLHDITAPPTEDTLSLINYYYFLQYTNAFQQKITNTRLNTNRENLENLIRCVQDGSPTLLCFYYGPQGKNGHAVVAYGMERAKYSKNGKAYDTKITIYDNNNVDYSSDYCLYINTSDYSWTIPHYETDKFSQSAIALVSDDIKFINQNGYLNGTDPILNRDYIAIMNSAQVTSDFMVSKIDLEEDTWSINSTSDEDDIQLFYSFDTASTESDLMFALMDSKSGYTMQLDNPEAQDLSIQYENCLLSADTSHSENIVFDPSGYIEINGMDTKYMLSMTFNEGHYENDWYKISILGNHADTVRMTKTAEGYLLKSDDLHQITVSVANDTINAVKSFSTDADQVLIYEIDENTIGIKTDLSDSDIMEYTSGDVTGDDTVNAADASQILIEAAAIGAGKNSSFTKVQNYSADVNNDNAINAGDSAFILQYSAYQGAGGTDALPIFIHEKN